MRRSASSANPHHARIVRPARNESGKFFRVQDSCEDFQTVYNARTGTGEICAGIYEINFAGACGRNRIKPRKSLEQLGIAARSIDVVTAKRKHDNLWMRIQHLLPLDLRRRLMRSA